jgi:hypothetical protein
MYSFIHLCVYVFMYSLTHLHIHVHVYIFIYASKYVFLFLCFCGTGVGTLGFKMSHCPCFCYGDSPIICPCLTVSSVPLFAVLMLWESRGEPWSAWMSSVKPHCTAQTLQWRLAWADLATERLRHAHGAHAGLHSSDQVPHLFLKSLWRGCTPQIRSRSICFCSLCGSGEMSSRRQCEPPAKHHCAVNQETTDGHLWAEEPTMTLCMCC